MPPIAFTDPNAVAGKSLAELFDITKNGNMQRMMPPWKNRLNDGQIWDAVAYAWTLHTTPAQVNIGKAVYEANYAACHGTDGKGTATGPNLSDFAATSKVSQAAWAQTVAGGKGKMPAFGDKLSAAEQAAGLEYVRSLAFGGPLFRGPLPKGTGVISGTVVNGTTGAPVPDLTVELGIFDQTSLLEQRTAKTDSAGVFRLTELPLMPGSCSPAASSTRGCRPAPTLSPLSRAKTSSTSRFRSSKPPPTPAAYPPIACTLSWTLAPARRRSPS